MKKERGSVMLVVPLILLATLLVSVSLYTYTSANKAIRETEQNFNKYTNTIDY